jgi:pilus assembly protein CpaE
MRYAVIAVTEGQPSANALRAVFEESDELELVDLLDTAGDVLRAVSRRECHVVLVDRSLSWTSPYDVVREIQGRLPHIAVLIVEKAGNPQALEAAVDAGARGVVDVSESFDEVRRRVLGAAQWSLKVRGLRSEDDVLNTGASTVTAVVGSKGGVGASTVALHVARQHRRNGLRVCVVDLDLTKGDIGLYANIEPRRDVTDLVGLGDGLSVQAIQDVVYVDKEGCAYLCAPRHPERGEQVEGDSIRNLLITLRQVYAHIIIDCGSSPSDVMGSALEVADDVLVVVTPDLASVRGANRVIDLCKRLSIRSPDEMTVLLNRMDRHRELQPSTIKRMTPSPVHAVEIFDSPKDLEAATNARNPSLVTSREFLSSIAKIAAPVTQPVASGKDPEPAGSDARQRWRITRQPRTESGVVTVEFMMLYPFLILLFVLCLQTVIYGAAHVQASHAAGAAASAAARGGDPFTAAKDEVNGKFRDSLQVGNPVDVGSSVDVKASVAVPRIVPKFFMGDGRVEVTGSAPEER